MKSIEIENDVYDYLVSHTTEIGENASSILRRLLAIDSKRKSQSLNVESSHELSEIFKDKNLALKRTVVDRYLWLLSKIHELRPDTFEEIFLLRGRARIYFARTQQEILATGDATNPQPIPETGYWALTNTPTQKKAKIIEDVMSVLNFSKAAIQAASVFVDA